MIKQVDVCKDCANRKLGCHADCQKYIQAKADVEEQKRLLKEFNEQNYFSFKGLRA